MTNLTLENVLDEKLDLHEKWVLQWGNSFSEIFIDKPCYYFTLPNIEGFIGYYIKSGCAVTFGNPVCRQENAQELAEAFCQYTNQNNWNTIFIFSHEEFSKWAIKNICKIMIDIGEEIIFDPQYDPLKTTGKAGNNLRNKLNHASEVNLKVEEYLGGNKEIEKELMNLGKEWVANKRGHQIYLAPLNLFKYRTGKRWFYLTNDDKILGIALLSRLEYYDGWFLKYIFVLQNAPKGSSEFLMISLLEKLKEENCKYLTYGSVPVNQIEEIEGLNRIASLFIRFIYSLTNRFFHLDHKKLYWEKFHPIEESTYILASHSLGLKELYAIRQVLNVEI